MMAGSAIFALSCTALVDFSVLYVLSHCYEREGAWVPPGWWAGLHVVP
jgi:hypothetical protein